MRVRVLGPLEVDINGRTVVPTAGKPRKVLSLLALYPDQVIPVPMLIEELWRSAPPRSALATLQTYILQLRRRIGAALGPESPVDPKSILIKQYGGYRLRVPDGCVDVELYQQLIAAARRSVEGGDDETASRIFREALDLWRGSMLVDVPAGPFLEIESKWLEESRLNALEQGIECDLRLGRHTEILAELIALIARYPFHEGLHAQCIIALCRSGRQSQALQVYQTLRARSVEKFGLELSPQMRKLHQAMLTADPSLDMMPRPRPGGPVERSAM
ncbi:hypothetical protein GCM10007079_08780 [Nocardiopsis terrae]|nr:AfsR/SARP family transcriptional regulator [Nocardiopsis terrae]GHC74484.1 hypothetical protein GCM10007079_08780 [Nocardiopsis terrae]